MRAVTGSGGQIPGELGEAADAQRCPTLLGWDELLADPRLARPFRHLIALDPPLDPAVERVLGRLPAVDDTAFVHLAWGPAEVDFALAIARAELHLRPAVTAVYRALRERSSSSAAELEVALRSQGHDRPSARAAARALQVLVELGLAAVADGPDGPSCSVVAGERTELERSPTFRACRARFEGLAERLERAPARAA